MVNRLKNEEKKTWYKRWWAIILFILIAVGILNYYFFSPQSYLRGEGYEVNSFYCTEKGWSNENILEGISSVDMKSLGNREDQIIDGLISISQACPPSKTIFVTIIEPTRECLYSFNGEVVKVWLEGLRQDNQSIPEESQRVINESSDFKYWEMQARRDYEDCIYLKKCLEIGREDCLDLNKECSALSYAYENYLENGITRNTISSIIYDYEINGKLSCE